MFLSNSKTTVSQVCEWSVWPQKQTTENMPTLVGWNAGNLVNLCVVEQHRYLCFRDNGSTCV